MSIEKLSPVTEECKVVIADGHELLREGLKAIFREVPSARIIGEASNIREAFGFLRDDHPDLLVLDPGLPGGNGASCIRRIRSVAEHVKIVVLTNNESEDLVYDCLDAGVNGFLGKTSTSRELVAAIQAVQEGKTFLSSGVLGDVTKGYLENRRTVDPIVRVNSLTKREAEVYNLVGNGKKNREIAEILYISIKTVEKHRANMMRKLRLKRAVEVRRLWSEHGDKKD